MNISQDSQQAAFCRSSLSTLILPLGLGLLLGLATVSMSNPALPLIALLGLFLAGCIINQPEYGLVALAFITHSNLSTTLIENLGLPSIAKILIPLLLVGIFFRLVVKREKVSGCIPLCILLAVFGTTQALSMLQSLDPEISDRTVFLLLKDSLVSIIVVFILVKASTLRAVIWALLASGALLGSVGMFQYLTGTFENTYWGLGLAPKHDIVDGVQSFRLSGSFGDPNFFALFQYILIPLAISRIYLEKPFYLKVAACYALATILFTVVFSYSRGAFVGIAFMAAIFMVLYPRRAWVIPAVILTGLVLVQFTPQSYYINRMLTVEYLSPSKKDTSFRDDSFDGRKSEMLSALLMLRDHPFLGVGPGCYEDNYQKYAQKLHLDFRLEDREAHSRYLETLAESGLVGFSAFSLLLCVMVKGLLRARKRALELHSPSFRHSVSAVIISIAGLLVGILFLHDAWQRFFWLLIGLSFAMPNIVENEIATQEKVSD